MADLTSQLFATAFPAAAQQSNLLPTGSGGGGRGGGAGGGGRGGVGVIGTSGGGGTFGQQPPFDERGLPQQQQGGSSPYGGGGRAGGEGAAGGGGGGGGGGVEGRIDLSGYRRVAKPKPVPADESEIIVSNSGNIRVYVESATELLTQGPPLLPAGGGGSAAAAGEQQGAAARGEGNLQRKPPLDRIFIKGASQAMANAILVAEGVRRAVPDLHMIVQAHAEEVLDDW